MEEKALDKVNAELKAMKEKLEKNEAELKSLKEHNVFKSPAPTLPEVKSQDRPMNVLDIIR